MKVYTASLAFCSLLSAPLLGFKGYTDLIDKRYNEVSFAATHNGQSHLPPTAETLIPVQNQAKPVKEQLEAGIRAMKIPLHWQDNQIFAAHGVEERKKVYIKSLIDKKLDELITQNFENKKKQYNYLITEAKKKKDDLVSKAPSYGELKDEAKKEGDKLIKIAENKVNNYVNAVKKADFEKEVKNNAETVLSPFISETVLNIYYHPEKVKPSDLDPAGRPFIALLKEIAPFIKENPTEIVTLFLEVYEQAQDGAKILKAFEAAGLADRLYVQDPAQPWPTLNDLATQQKNLVVFLDFSVDSKRYPFNHFKSFVWSSEYQFGNVDELNADTGLSRQPDKKWFAQDNKVWILQHFITETTGGSLIKAPDANKKEVILNRVERYKKNLNLPKPNFIWVDFFDTGSLTAAQKAIADKSPLKLSLNDLKNKKLPTIDVTALATQQDVFETIDTLNRS